MLRGRYVSVSVSVHEGYCAIKIWINSMQYCTNVEFDGKSSSMFRYIDLMRM